MNTCDVCKNDSGVWLINKRKNTWRCFEHATKKQQNIILKNVAKAMWSVVKQDHEILRGGK